MNPKISHLSVRRLAISSAPWFGGEIPSGQFRTFEFPLLEIGTDQEYPDIPWVIVRWARGRVLHVNWWMSIPGFCWAVIPSSTKRSGRSFGCCTGISTMSVKLIGALWMWRCGI